jgi:Tfp pilus assembly protein PilE
MSKLIVAIITATFALGAAPGYAQTTYKKEALTEAQKGEIRERVERLKAERTKAEQERTTTPVKAKAPAKQSSKAKKHHAKAAPKATAQPAKKVQPKA